MVRIVTALFATVGAGLAQPLHVAKPLTTECARLLATLVTPERAVEGDLATELARRAAGGALGRREAVDHLVREKVVTVARAQTLFTEASLARFSNVFLIYLVAELRARGFDDEHVANFVMVAARAYPLEQRVGFAYGVTARMMLTLNDQPTSDAPGGLAHFLSAARAFNVSEEDFADFLEIWRTVRDAPAATAVHFVLATLEQICEALGQERDERVVLRDLARLGRGSVHWLRVVTGLGPRPLPTRGELGRARLGKLDVPDFVGTPAWARVGSTLSRIERYLNVRPTADLGDVDRAPPFARAFVLGRVIPHLATSELARVRTHQVWPRLDLDQRLAVIADLELFERVDGVRERIRQAVTRDREVDRLRPADPSVQKYFFERFDAGLEEVARRYRTAATTARMQALVTGIFDKTQAKFPKLGTPEVLAIARRVIDAVAATDLLHGTVAAARAMMLITREFDLDDGDRRSLVRQLKTYEFTAHNVPRPITSWSCAEAVLDEDAWGRASEYVPPVVSRELAKLLDRVRRQFEPESVPLDDQTLLRRLIERDVGPRPPRADPRPPAAPPARVKRMFGWDWFSLSEVPECRSETEF